MQPFRVFIGWDSRFTEPAEVLAYSIRKQASVPVLVDYLRLDELQAQRGFGRAWDPKQTTEFTYTRFLVPWLCNYEGTALFLDNDMLCLGDVAELASLPMSDYALRCVKHDHQPVDGTLKMNGAVQTSYPRKNWSSMMLFNCDRLRLWSKEVVEAQTGAYLHRFQDIPDDLIGELPAGWNALDSCGPSTKLVHWTSGMVWNYPDWKERRQRGNLQDEFPHQDLWLRWHDDWWAETQANVADC